MQGISVLESSEGPSPYMNMDPIVNNCLETVNITLESLRSKEQDLEDEINDKFDQVVAIIEERRACLLTQLHSRVSSVCEKLGTAYYIALSFIFSFIEDSQRKYLEDNNRDEYKTVSTTHISTENDRGEVIIISEYS